MIQLTLAEEKERAYYISMILQHPKLSMQRFATRIQDDKESRGEPVRGTSDTYILKRMRELGIIYPYNFARFRKENSVTYTNVEELETGGALLEYMLLPDVMIEEEQASSDHDISYTFPTPEGEKQMWKVNGQIIWAESAEAAVAWYKMLTNF